MSRTILVVDDESKILNMVYTFLTGRGFKVFTACHGREALRVAKNQKPDLILMDVVMPQMDGILALSHLKRDPDTCRIPVLAWSTSFGDQVPATFHRHCVGMLEKPFEMSALATEIRFALAS
jgi:two-component system alkaline phosphatase synthesis response regulator PhoP